VREYNNVA